MARFSEEKYIGFPPEVRITHNIHLVSFITIALSGFLISNPQVIPILGFKDLKWIGFTHIVSAIVLYATSVFRMYYALGSGDYVNYKLLPEDWPKMWEWLKYYFFIQKTKPVQRKFNPLQKFTYYTLITLLLLQAVTGLTLYFKGDLGILLASFGGLQRVRTLHFFIAVMLSSLIAVHFYLVFTAADQRGREAMFALGRIRPRE